MERMANCKYCGTKYTYSTYLEEGWEVERHELCPNCGYYEDFAYGYGSTNKPIYEELKRYRDTGLTPEEVTALRAELDAVKRERDAAVGDMEGIVDGKVYCYKCKKDGNCETESIWSCGNFEWRGVQEGVDAKEATQD